MPSVISHAPRLEVRLYKTISRTVGGDGMPASTRYVGKNDYIDLAPMLGDGSSVRTSKGIREPAGGFSISVADRPHTRGFSLESIYGLVEPMDVVEIRMSHHASSIVPVVMRGFVSNVSRQQSMGPNGHPQRSVIITGHDYGKIWQMIQILFKPRMLTGEHLLSSFKLFEMYGMGTQNALPAGQFIRDCIEKIVNKQIADMMPSNSSMPREIKPEIHVKRGTVSIHMDNTEGSSLYDLMRTHGDVGIWNELYVEDRQDGVYGVYRPKPDLSVVKGEDGKRTIQEDAPAPVYVDISDRDIISLSVSRSDSDVANFYWVEAPRDNMVTDTVRQTNKYSQETILLNDYPNSAVKYYGPRAMYAVTQQGGDDQLNHKSGPDEAGIKRRSGQIFDWVEFRRKAMVEMNKDNVLFERGSARIKGGQMRGNEPMKAGDYARIRQGRFVADYYVTHIDHEFIPYQGYFSTLQLDRGEGFINRSVIEGRGGQSPWLTEQMRGGGL